MRSKTLLLLAALQLAAARQPGFSIHEDILAYPQFEVVFSDSYILEGDAQRLLDGAADPSAYQSNAAAASATPSSQSDVAHPGDESTAVKEHGAGSTSGATGKNGDDSDAADDGSEQVSETFEIMNVPPSRYLCSVPVLAPPAPPNQTATELARAEEARELARMSDRGIEIISTLEGECMYYVSGWWSYSFCYGKEIVQFHATTTKTGKPVKDPHSQEYILGRMQGQQNDNTAAGEAAAAAAAATAGNKMKQAKKDLDVQKPLGGNANSAGSTTTQPTGEVSDPYNTELVVKGDQRYMVQRLGMGTVCDLTGRDRTIEIQYHCNPGGTSDRISWIKEVTTCSYLMEVRTPRLCEEGAFLPPKPARAHPISCRQIVSSEEEVAKWHHQKTIEAYAAMQGIKAKEKATAAEEAQEGIEDIPGQGQAKNQDGIVVGGVVIGARKALGRGEDGQPPLKLELPKHFGRDGAELVKGQPRVVKVLVRAASKANGGEVSILSTDELKELNIRHDVIQELVGKLTKIAGGKAWRLEAVENPGESALEIRAVLEPEDGEEPEWGTGSGTPAKKAEKVDKDEKTEDAKEEAVEKPEKKKKKGTKVTVTVEKVDKKGKETEAPKAQDGGDAVDDGGEEGSEETFKKDEL
ncbi:Protein OS-9 [Sporothrix stenoceras]|uniref:Endoplasmic reticulum lectin n=1 Tax=Sporothrix stenoceras TaxID=5173 RepID=A0ABR3YZB9_9PEZI